MALPDRQTIIAFIDFAKESSVNRRRIEDWRAAAFTAIEGGQGGAINSGGGNGVSFAQSGDHTNFEIFTFTGMVLKSINTNNTPTSRTFGRIC